MEVFGMQCLVNFDLSTASALPLQADRIPGRKCPPLMSRMELQIAGLCAGVVRG